MRQAGQQYEGYGQQPNRGQMPHSGSRRMPQQMPGQPQGRPPYSPNMPQNRYNTQPSGNPRMPQNRIGQQMPYKPQPPVEEPTDKEDKKKGNKKLKPPVSSGKAFTLGLLASFFMCLLMAAGLIGFSTLRDSKNVQEQQAFLDEQAALIQEASTQIHLSPSENSVQTALQGNANITVIRSNSQTTTQNNSNQTNPEQNNSGQNANTPNNATPNANDTNAQQTPSATTQDPNAQTPNAPAPATAANSNVENSTGAGVVLSSDGNILTSLHVVKDAQEIQVDIAGTIYQADIVGTDPTSDLAVIKINAKNLQTVVQGDSDQVQVGDWCMLVGNPYGLHDTLSAGNISALGRDILYPDGEVDIMYANMIQTDAALNPGNSGGGLYNQSGELIGIATLITSPTSGSAGIGYAIPINYALRIANNLVSQQQPQHAVLGLSLSDVPESVINQYGLSSSNGAYITNVTQSGPAATAGITNGDIVVKFNDLSVVNSNDLLFKVRALPVNTEVNLTILREGKEMKFNVKLGSDV